MRQQNLPCAHWNAFKTGATTLVCPRFDGDWQRPLLAVRALFEGSIHVTTRNPGRY